MLLGALPHISPRRFALADAASDCTIPDGFPILEPPMMSCNSAFQEVELTALRIDKLSLLKTLDINGGRTSNIRECFFTRHPIYRASACSIQLFCVLSSSLGMYALEQFLSNEPTMQTFHKLHTLRITFLGNIDFTRIHAYIALFPAIRELRLVTTGSRRAPTLPSSTPQVVLSHLEYYKGSAEFLPLLLAGAAAPKVLVIDRASSI
ncbi:hypothetical protein C8R43DRAFT_1192559 [Mycena crocata]|nr:hypothetical protein C8R43DRAFT_1192559 [Mycena crocata]